MPRYYVINALDFEQSWTFRKKKDADEAWENLVAVDRMQDGVYLEINTNFRNPSITVHGMRDKGFLVGDLEKEPPTWHNFPAVRGGRITVKVFRGRKR